MFMLTISHCTSGVEESNLIQTSGFQLLSWGNGSVRKKGNENCVIY